MVDAYIYTRRGTRVDLPDLSALYTPSVVDLSSTGLSSVPSTSFLTPAQSTALGQPSNPATASVLCPPAVARRLSFAGGGSTFIADTDTMSSSQAYGVSGDLDLVLGMHTLKYAGAKGEPALDFKKRVEALITSQKAKNPLLDIVTMLSTIQGQVAPGSVVETFIDWARVFMARDIQGAFSGQFLHRRPWTAWTWWLVPQLTILMMSSPRPVQCCRS